MAKGDIDKAWEKGDTPRPPLHAQRDSV